VYAKAEYVGIIYRRQPTTNNQKKRGKNVKKNWISVTVCGVNLGENDRINCHPYRRLTARRFINAEHLQFIMLDPSPNDVERVFRSIIV